MPILPGESQMALTDMTVGQLRDLIMEEIRRPQPNPHEKLMKLMEELLEVLRPHGVESSAPDVESVSVHPVNCAYDAAKVGADLGCLFAEGSLHNRKVHMVVVVSYPPGPEPAIPK